MKKTVFALAMSLCGLTAFAQSGTNSPYSQYGLGELAGQTNGFNRGMNGVGIALREHAQINYLNPASYADIDSVTFVFDAGMSLQLTNFTEGSVKKNARTANFEYAVGGFRVMRHLGLGFGFIPYSNIGYNYSTSADVTGTKSYNGSSISETTCTKTYSGSGGLHEAFIGLGYSPVRNLNIGFNAGFLWGEYTKTVGVTYSDSYVNSLTRSYTANVYSYKLDFGAQYLYQINKKDAVTIGATYTIGHKLNADPTLDVISTNSQTSVADTTSVSIKHGLSIPTKLGIGAAYNHGTKWRVALDWTTERWANMEFPKYSTYNEGSWNYALAKNQFNNRNKINFGGEYCQNMESRKFLDRIRYRFGASYTTSYLKINGIDGPSETSISAGFGIPIINAYNNRSILNISAQWVHAGCKSLITENSFRINVGLTFNEKWFAKWKFE